MAEPEWAAAAKKDFLLALAEKGETVAEVAAFARVFRARAVDPGLDDWAARGIDIVGTGGSGSGGYNVSSVAACIVAAAGVPVLKHGNRAITSQSGSADFLAACGIPLEADPARLRASLEHLNFCFFFAPAFHPAFKEIMPVRRELAAAGRKTVFNILGPLINPARPHQQMLGVFTADWVAPLARVLGQLGVRRGLAVHSRLADGRNMDELTTAGANRVCGMGGLAAVDTTWQPVELGFGPAAAADLNGGSPAENLELLRAILAGRGRPGLVDTIVLNAAAAFWIMRVTDDLAAGCALARQVLLDGALAAWLEKVRAFHA